MTHAVHVNDDLAWFLRDLKAGVPVRMLIAPAAFVAFEDFPLTRISCLEEREPNGQGLTLAAFGGIASRSAGGPDPQRGDTCHTLLLC